MIQITKQDLVQLDIGDWANLPQAELDEQVKRVHKLSRFSTWLLPQLVAHFGTWQIYDNGREMVTKNCVTNQQRAFYRLAMTTRSNILDNQVKNPEYGQLTPLILLGFKRHRGISYENWRDYPGLDWILEPKLYTAVVNQAKLDISTERLLELQTIGLTIKSSTVDPSKIGTLHKASSAYGLNGLQGTELDGLDKLTQMLLCQTWLAHPQNRRETMILDPNNWDSMPQPLVEWQPVASVVNKTNLKFSRPLPWATV
jgi:hypothetical protein